MSRKSVIQRNLKRISICSRLKSKRDELKAIIKDQSVSMNDRFLAQVKLSKLPRDSSYIRIRNRCLVTGRPRGCYRKFKVSRIVLRQLGSIGQIPGLTKSSW
ncbi:30S ribosomal protein S14 [Ehrlichia minasensis]|uniref:Small ribosomal subunit protein uS14 n=1 Tax=Ehrlichia minasensis TaxID=1242993 RepID=A0A4Q6I5D1_9RICK|nr:30S ribosomal protein S14 [Ehrlichia minasensis]RZB13101.1 30S ribosomal protein S14 [Ehrlichia minasensis]CEI85287.1 30S ribosomal protein S14 [Ehrlichia minasensis]